jgi:hypothetical protein
VAALVLGARKALSGVRVSVAEISAAAPSASADVLVVTDAGHVSDDGLPAVLRGWRAALGEGNDGVLALVVGSPVTRSLVATASDDAVRAMSGREDAYARAVVWASARAADATLAPPLVPERLAAFVDAAAAAGLTLVEPELSASSPVLSRIRGMRSPRARALAVTLALGAGARPLLFLPSPAAPKGGLARPKVERLVDTWVSAAPTSEQAPAATDIVSAARAVLRASTGPLPFKDLLREARARWTTQARAAGARATPSSADARDLATALHHLGAADAVTLFALDPSAPDWTLTLLEPHP